MNCYMLVSRRFRPERRHGFTKRKIEAGWFRSKEYVYGDSESDVINDFEAKHKELLDDGSLELLEIKKRKYIVLSSECREELEEEVNDWVWRGWCLLGSVSVGRGGSNDSGVSNVYVQSLEWRS